MRRVSIVQGENAVVAEPDVVVSTLLGSCVAACLYDPVAKVGGMNHFLLGEPNADHRVSASDMSDRLAPVCGAVSGTVYQTVDNVLHQ